MKMISTSEVHQLLDSKGAVIVDTRSSHAFIGWRMEGEVHKGHIKGATDFSADWLEIGEQPKKGVWLDEKRHYRNLEPGTTVVLYDVDEQRAQKVAVYLESVGINDISYFSLKEWDGEMEACPEYWRMVPPSWVKDLIDGKNPEHYDGKGYKIFHTFWGPTDQRYTDGHIPGAVHIDTEEFEVGPEWIRVSDQELEKFACSNGITIDTTVIVYGEGSGKLNLILQYMGVKKALLVNGGFQAWIRAGYPLEKGENPKLPVAEFGGTIPALKEVVMDIDEAKLISKGLLDEALVDIRPWTHYIGAESGYDYVPKAGRIPNSRWCFDPHFYMNPDGTMENPEEMLEIWKRYGVDLSKRNGFFCGSASWGGATITVLARVAGIPNVCMYEGGWCQWQLDPENEWEVGVPIRK